MEFFRSLSGARLRKVFLCIFAFSSLLPLLVVVLIAAEYLLPAINPGSQGHALDLLSIGTAIALAFPLLGLYLLARWIRTFENLAREVQSKSSEVIERTEALWDRLADPGTAQRWSAARESSPPEEENEIQSLIHSFNRIFQTTADQIAEREYLRELLASLIAVASDLTSELDFDRLFPLVVSRVTTVMAAERTSLYVIDWEKRELWTKVAEGIKTIRLPIGQGISGRVAETGESLNVADAWELSYFDRSFDQRNRYRTRSVLCVPIRSRTGQNIGVLQVINKLGGGPFDSRDEIILKGLASHVGIALENSLLIDEIKLSFTHSVGTLSAMVDARHPLTAGHSRRVTEYVLLIAREMGLDGTDIEVLRLAALLHDIGKIGIPDAVLLKDGSFTPEERAEMDSHPVKTRQILEKFHFPRALRTVPEIAGNHHEMIDGSGYPDGRTGDDLSLAAKIIAVADVFDALTSTREYPKYVDKTSLERGPMPLEKVVSLLRQESGSRFAPEVVEAFLRCLPRCLQMYRGDHFPAEYVDETLRRLVPEGLSDGLFTPPPDAFERPS